MKYNNKKKFTQSNIVDILKENNLDPKLAENKITVKSNSVEFEITSASFWIDINPIGPYWIPVLAFLIGIILTVFLIVTITPANQKISNNFRMEFLIVFLIIEAFLQLFGYYLYRFNSKVVKEKKRIIELILNSDYQND